jgi:hypothetical protein
VLVFVFYNRLAYTVQVGGFILKQFNSIQFNCSVIVVDGRRYEIHICRGIQDDDDDDDERRISIGSVVVSGSVKRF